jgi:cobyrinic acid a,c-diamide synthase
VAHDTAFSFSYPHLLEGWRAAGADLQFFSPLADEAAPGDADFVFLPGGYPELHAGRIAGNAVFLGSLRRSMATIYGECGGYMVLGQGLTDAQGQRHAMAGLLPHVTSFATRKLHLGYRQLCCASGPFPRHLRGHEFHYSTEAAGAEPAPPLFQARNAAGDDLGPMGQRLGRVMGSYAHIIAEAAS